MVFVDANLEKDDVVRWSKFHTYGFQRMGYFRREHIPSVLYRADQVVYEQRLVVWFSNVVCLHSVSMPCGVSAASRRRKGIVSAIIFPTLILKVQYGFVYSYIVHWVFYTLTAVGFWIIYAKLQENKNYDSPKIKL